MSYRQRPGAARPRSTRFLFLLATIELHVAVAESEPASTPGTSAPFDVVEKSILELQAAQSAGQTTGRALVDAYAKRIAAYDRAGPALNSIVRLNPRAAEEADALDRERARTGARGPLHGIPVLIKYNYDTRDMPTSGARWGLPRCSLQPMPL